jgi:hypothetical protein
MDVPLPSEFYAEFQPRLKPNIQQLSGLKDFVLEIFENHGFTGSARRP